MPLAGEYLPATRGGRQELVLLHGWGCDREVWRPLVAAVRPWAGVTLCDLPALAPGAAGEGDGLASLLEAILDAAPPKAVYVGWSLGGQLALELAARHPKRVEALVTLCSNPRFVADRDWPGMPDPVFRDFEAAYRRDPAATLRRFDALQAAGVPHPRSLLRALRRMRRDRPATGLAAGLGWLAALDQRPQAATPAQPRLHLFGGADRLVPAECAARLAELAGSAGQVDVVAGVSHLLPLQAPALVAERIRAFLERAGLLGDLPAAPPLLDKADVAASFSRAAADYDSVASLQRDVGTRLLDELAGLDVNPARILDLGCGTGHFQPHLAHRFPGAEYVGLDIAEGMVNYARDHCGQAARWVVGDAESLPLAAGSVDLVFSSLAIQWCYRPDLLFAELARVLRPGGVCLFTSLGPETLRELRAAWAAVDRHQHVNTFLPAEQLQSAAGRIPGLALRLASRHFSMRYDRAADLLRELKTLGAHNLNRGRPGGLTGRRALQRMFDAYEPWRQGGLLPATYDVLFGVLAKR